MRRIFSRGGLALVLGALMLTGAFAEENDGGPEQPDLFREIQVNPYFRFRNEYRDNIYLTGQERKSDLVSIFTPGVELVLPAGGGDLALDYHADALLYWSESDNNTLRHFLGLEGQWTLAPAWSWSFENTLMITDDPPLSELVEREDRLRNRFNTTFYFDARRTRLETGFTTVRDDYRKLDQLDRTENYLTLTGAYRFLPRTSWLLSYRVGEVRYDIAPDRKASYNELTTGVRGHISPKVTGEVRAGFQWRDYRDPGRSDFDGVVVYGGVTHDLSPRVRNTLSVLGGVQESSFGDNSYYRTSRAGYGYRHVLGRRHAASAGVSWEENRYPVAVAGALRRDRIWTLRAGWDYTLRRWATVGLGYEFRKRDSTFPRAIEDFNYRDHVIMVSCNLAF